MGLEFKRHEWRSVIGEEVLLSFVHQRWKTLFLEALKGNFYIKRGPRREGEGGEAEDEEEEKKM